MARANNLGVILDIHQDYWSPALHNISKLNETQGYCEGVGMPSWMYRPMTVVDYTTNQAIPVVRNALATGLVTRRERRGPVIPSVWGGESDFR
jgi:hypothetical protein